MLSRCAIYTARQARYLMFRVLAAILLLSWPFLSPVAQEIQTICTIETVNGALRIEREGFDEFLRLGDYELERNLEFYISIVSRVPRKGAAEFVVYSVAHGGNCCPGKFNLLDAGAKPPRTIEISWWTDDNPAIVDYRPGSITLRHVAEKTTPLGDPIVEVIKYQRGHQDFEVVRHSAISDYKKFVGKWPDDFLADAKARYSLVDLMGTKDFAKFRQYIGESSEKMSMVDGQFLVGEGHGRGTGLDWRYSLFVVDTFFDQAWSLERDENTTDGDPDPGIKYRAWGYLAEENETARTLLDDWLRQFGKETAWKSGPIEIVDSVLVPAPPPPPWHPRRPDTMQPY